MKYPLTLTWLGHSFMQVLAIGAGIWLQKELAIYWHTTNLV